MAWEFLKGCSRCGVKRVLVISGTEAEAIATADHEWIHGLCNECQVIVDAEEAAKPPIEELFADVLAVLR